MIKTITFDNFRNIKGTYDFSRQFNVVIGQNNSGKTNLLDGIKLAFSCITGDYFRVSKTDFFNSDDDKTIRIIVVLDDKIETLSCCDRLGNLEYGFIVEVRKTSNGKYNKKLKLLNDQYVDYDMLREDANVPQIISLPLIRTDDLYSKGFSTDLSIFISESSDYQKILDDARAQSKELIKEQVIAFSKFCEKFNQTLDVELSNPNLSDEKAHIIDKNSGNKEHSSCIGSGYKSIATIMLNTMSGDYNVVLIDEIENHLHPSLIRTVVEELKKKENCVFICSTHSPVVINECSIEDLIFIGHDRISKKLDSKTINKLDIFMHPGRAELLFSENILLVEGYSEELVLKKYIRDKKYNITVINVNGIMFKPYIELCVVLNKRIAVISDTDICLQDNVKVESNRFLRLKEFCDNNNVPVIKMYNTFETDAFRSSLIDDSMLHSNEKHPDILIANNGYKTYIARKMIEENVDLSKWHIITEIEKIFKD